MAEIRVYRFIQYEDYFVQEMNAWFVKNLQDVETQSLWWEVKSTPTSQFIKLLAY